MVLHRPVALAALIGNVVMADMVAQHQRARDAAILLGRELGVMLPRQLDSFLAKSQTIAPILAQAFDVAIIGGFVTAGIMALSRVPAYIDNIV